MPERIQLRRTRGWRKPEGAVVVSRPSRWGNPFTVAAAIESGFADRDTAQAFVVEAFRSWLEHGPQSPWWFEAGRERFVTLIADLPQLAGRDLACWCRPGVPCHADVLIDLANRRPSWRP